jgi:hypothetical protein
MTDEDLQASFALVLGADVHDHAGHGRPLTQPAALEAPVVVQFAPHRPARRRAAAPTAARHSTPQCRRRQRWRSAARASASVMVWPLRPRRHAPRAKRAGVPLLAPAPRTTPRNPAGGTKRAPWRNARMLPVCCGGTALRHRRYEVECGRASVRRPGRHDPVRRRATGAAHDDADAAAVQGVQRCARQRVRASRAYPLPRRFRKARTARATGPPAVQSASSARAASARSRSAVTCSRSVADSPSLLARPASAAARAACASSRFGLRRPRSLCLH